MQRIIPPNPIQEWLVQPIYASNIIYIDHWSLVHFATGFLLGYLLLHRWKTKNPWVTLLIILAAYEIFEYFIGPIIFNPESFLDIIWDIVIGTLGFVLYRFIKYSTNTPTS